MTAAHSRRRGRREGGGGAYQDGDLALELDADEMRLHAVGPARGGALGCAAALRQGACQREGNGAGEGRGAARRGGALPVSVGAVVAEQLDAVAGLGGCDRPHCERATASRVCAAEMGCSGAAAAHLRGDRSPASRLQASRSHHRLRGPQAGAVDDVVARDACRRPKATTPPQCRAETLCVSGVPVGGPAHKAAQFWPEARQRLRRPRLRPWTRALCCSSNG